MTALVSAVTSISHIVSGIGIANTILVSVTERTREIGIGLAIGALPAEVRLRLLTEAVVLCLLCSVIGVIRSLPSLVVARLIGVSFPFSRLVNLGSLVFASILRVLFGFVPAQRAAALNPLDALRHELGRLGVTS